MSKGYATDSAGEPQEHIHDPPDSDWLELQRLLIGDERQRLSRVEERLNSPEILAKDIGAILPKIISHGIEANALGVSEALLLVIGPSIRTAISVALQEMLRNLDRLLENSLSPTAWKWRLEALRTGKPFAEIVLLHSLQYRVEQVFLIHRRTSLVIRHVQAPSALSQDPALVSAMLSAIQDFVHHSFDSGRPAELHVVQAGDLTIWVEQGPLAFLAAAIRGSPPLELRTQLRAALDRIHLFYYPELERFQGDSAPFEPTTEVLESCLVFQLRPEVEKKKPVLAFAFCAILFALLLAAFLLYLRETWRWRDYVAKVKTEPGIVVMSSGSGVWKHSIAGMRDPLGADPMRVLRSTLIDPKRVIAEWRPYASISPEMVLIRAKHRLNPPEGVSFAYENGVLRIFGRAPASWIARATNVAITIPGVERFDATGLKSIEEHDLEQMKKAVEDIVFFFGRERRYLDAPQIEAAHRAASVIAELAKTAEAAGKVIKIRVAGRADKEGGIRENAALSRQRAKGVTDLLLSEGLKPSWFEAVGYGTTRPIQKEDGDEKVKAYNRSASFEVAWSDRSADREPRR